MRPVHCLQQNMLARTCLEMMDSLVVVLCRCSLLACFVRSIYCLTVKTGIGGGDALAPSMPGQG